MWRATTGYRLVGQMIGVRTAVDRLMERIRSVYGPCTRGSVSVDLHVFGALC